MEPPGTVVVRRPNRSCGRESPPSQTVPRPSDTKGVSVGLKKYKPTSPGRRFQTVSPISRRSRRPCPRSRCWSPLPKKERRNNNGASPTRHQGGATSAVPRHRLQAASKDGVPAKVVATIGVRPEPLRRASLAVALRRRREALHPRAEGSRGRADHHRRLGSDIRPGNALPLSDIPTGTVVHAVRAAAWQGCCDRAIGGHVCPAHGKEADTRSCACPHWRCGVLVTCRATVGEVGQRRSREHLIGKAAVPGTWAFVPTRSWYRHEPGHIRTAVARAKTKSAGVIRDAMGGSHERPPVRAPRASPPTA